VEKAVVEEKADFGNQRMNFVNRPIKEIQTALIMKHMESMGTDTQLPTIDSLIDEMTTQAPPSVIEAITRDEMNEEIARLNKLETEFTELIARRRANVQAAMAAVATGPKD
jgi:hypothetical protein